MKVLLDTHAFLWWVHDDPRLSPPARRIIADGENILFLSSHSRKALVDRFGEEHGGRLWARFTVHYTPKHGSWLNQALRFRLLTPSGEESAF